jgi:hypothetical protein
LGLILPATAEPEGYLAEKAPPQGQFHFELEMGMLTPAEAQHMEEKITQIVTEQQ